MRQHGGGRGDGAPLSRQLAEAFRSTEKRIVGRKYLQLNTPGAKNGVLRAWVDGRLAFEKTDIRFRNVDRLKIEQVWMNVYHGGTKPSPHDQHLFIDNVVVARKYIGPLGQ